MRRRFQFFHFLFLPSPPFPEKQKPAHVEEKNEGKTRINILTFPFSHKTISHKSPKKPSLLYFRENQGGGKGTLRRFPPPLTEEEEEEEATLLPSFLFPPSPLDIPWGKLPPPVLPPQGGYTQLLGEGGSPTPNSSLHYISGCCCSWAATPKDSREDERKEEWAVMPRVGGEGRIAPNPTFVGRGRPVVVLEVGTYEVHSIVIVRRRDPLEIRRNESRLLSFYSLKFFFVFPFFFWVIVFECPILYTRVIPALFSGKLCNLKIPPRFQTGIMTGLQQQVDSHVRSDKSVDTTAQNVYSVLEKERRIRWLVTQVEKTAKKNKKLDL